MSQPSGPVGVQEPLRQRRALRTLMLVLIPLAVWTFGALIALWPANVANHVTTANSQWTAVDVTTLRATITKVTEMSCEGVMGSATGDRSTCARVQVVLDDGPDRGRTTEVQLTAAHYASGVQPGQQLLLFRVPVPNAEAAYSFADFERRTPMGLFALVFAVCVVAVARWRGFASLLGLVFAGFVLFKFLLPALIVGHNPVLIGVVAGSAIMFVVLYAAHGFNARTSTALLGTLFGLALSAALGWASVRWTHLTGVASEDDFSLAAMAPDLKLTSVAICGLIIAGLGVLNDVTITQASAVWELADHETDGKVLFGKAMRIGRDHIASTVYTIAFASAGAVLSVLLLLAIYQRPFFDVIVTEQFAGEVMRTLVGSIGLVLAVPLTTAIAVWVVGSSRAPSGGRLGPAVLAQGDEFVDAEGERASRGSDEAFKRPAASQAGCSADTQHPDG